MHTVKNSYFAPASPPLVRTHHPSSRLTFRCFQRYLHHLDFSMLLQMLLLSPHPLPGVILSYNRTDLAHNLASFEY
jgi:hypothetical protein